jgi:hypothetical protein
MEVMRIIAKRIDDSFDTSWNLVEEYETIREEKEGVRKRKLKKTPGKL